MSNLEFSLEFDLLYNNIRSNNAPGINEYEKSLFLTIAQEQTVFNYFNPKGNKYLEGFEGSEKRRRDLEELVKNYTVKSATQPTKFTLATDSESFKVATLDSYFVEIPSSTWLITQEQAELNDNEAYSVLPITHDELTLQANNPFRKPQSSISQKLVWRLDNGVKTVDTVEIVVPTGSTINKYQMRYVEKPSPIILTDIASGEFTGLGLKIDGVSNETPCKLKSTVHRQILTRAVELALEAFEKGRLQTFQLTSSRSE